jgi:nucleoside-diphosphate-sugar epimerase
MYIDDTIKGIKSVITSSRSNITCDFCSGTPLSIDDLVLTAAQTFGIKDPNIVHEGISEEYIEFSVTIDAMKEHFGFQPTTPLSKGFWYLADFLKGENH